MGHVRVCVLLIQVLHCSGLYMNLPAPVHLSIRSQHFVHLLSWEAGPGSPEETRFTVFVCSIKENWKPVSRCTLVHSPLWCNLTDEFSDPKETYYTKVYACLGNQTSDPAVCPAFQPARDTVPLPPLLKVSQCNQSLCVQLQPPSPSLFTVYNSPIYGFRYKLNVTVRGFVQFWSFTEGLSDVVLEHLPAGQEYCVSVTIKDRSDASIPVCTLLTAAGYNSDAAVLGGLSVMVLLVLMGFLLLWISGFLCLKSPPPSVLSSFQKQYPVFLLPWIPVSFSSILVEPRADEEVDEDVAKRIEGEEYSGVIYEGWRGKTLSGEETSHSSNPFDSPKWNWTPCTSVDHVIETQTREASCSTEVAVPQLCQTSFQLEAAKATSRALDPGLLLPEPGLDPGLLLPEPGLDPGLLLPEPGLDPSLLLPEPGTQEFRQKHRRPFRQGQGRCVEAEVTNAVNVNLSSLVLGGCWGEQEVVEDVRTGQVGSSQHVDHGVLSPLKKTSNTAQNSRSTDLLLSRGITPGAEDDEEEEEEEDNSGYLQRN